MSKTWFLAALALIVLIGAGANVLMYAEPEPSGLTVPAERAPADQAPTVPAERAPADQASDRMVTASRLFAGPVEYPPQEFAAYGILAFRSRSSPYDRDRHFLICNAYLATLPPASELTALRAQQMVTVWPLDSNKYSDMLNRSHIFSSDEIICDIAVDNYGLVTAQGALKDAASAGADISGPGPFLLAWSPSIEKGKRDALVLVSDLSYVTTYGQALEIFLAWSQDIERDPTLWNKGWNYERLRGKIRYWVDNFGSKSLALFGVR